MAGEAAAPWWETYSGYVKLGSAVAGAVAVAVGGWHLRENDPAPPAADSPAVYDQRVQEAAADIKVLEAESRAIDARVRVNSESIARLKAEMEALHGLADERERRFLAVETEGKRLAERQEDILDRLRGVEKNGKR